MNPARNVQLKLPVISYAVTLRLLMVNYTACAETVFFNSGF